MHHASMKTLRRYALLLTRSAGGLFLLVFLASCAAILPASEDSAAPPPLYSAGLTSFEYPGADGKPIEGFFTFPAGENAPLRSPCILFLHGQVGFWRSYRHYARQLARLGFGVLYINYYSARYVNLKEGVRPFDDRVRRFRLLLEDIARGVDALAAQSSCDPHAISVAGFSLGGSYAFHIAAMRPNKVAAVVSFYGGYRFPPLMNTWDIRLSYLFADEDGRKWYEWMKRQDPQSLIGKFRGPVLLLHGRSDDWVPFKQAEKFYAALLKRGIPAELVEVPGGGHDFMFSMRPDPGQMAIKKMVEFLERRVVAAARKKERSSKR